MLLQLITTSEFLDEKALDFTIVRQHHGALPRGPSTRRYKVIHAEATWVRWVDIPVRTSATIIDRPLAYTSVSFEIVTVR